MSTKILVTTAALAASLVLAGCGGGDDVTTASSTTTLSGTAAVGVPIVAGQISVTCSGGSALSTTTDSAGAWQVTTSGQTLPCAVQVSGGTVGGSANGTPYHSIAMSFGTINITPLTDLVIANLTGKAPNAWFTGLNAAALQGLSGTALTDALNRVNTALGLSATLNGSNPLTVNFTATNGNLIDDILEALAGAGSNHAALLALAAQANFTAPSGFDFATAYTAVQAANGGGSSTCTSGQTNARYDGSGPYTKGQTVCFTASTTALTFSGKTLTNPTKNTVVSAPFAAYAFADGAYVYEVILQSGVLYEINVSDTGGKFYGQFAPV